MSILKKITAKALVVFVCLMGAQGVAQAQIQLGPNNCQLPSAVTIKNEANYWLVRAVTEVDGIRYLDKKGYIVNCNQNAYIGKTQWVVFYMKGTDYFKPDLSSQTPAAIGDHTGFMARASMVSESPDPYRGIGPIFHPRWGTIGEIYDNTDVLANKGCQAIAGTYPTGPNVIRCPTNGMSPNEHLAVLMGWSPPISPMINSNVPMLDDRIYRVVVHANQNSMSYAVTDTYTGQTANGWVSQTIPQTITANGEQKQVGGQTASYSTQGGMGFFKLDRDDIGRFTTTKVEYWGIQSGWF